MQFKNYQTETLDALTRYLRFARAEGPEKAFVRIQPSTSYQALAGLPEAPYICLRLPTGGGKTILAAKSIEIAGKEFLDRDLPLTLWMVPSDAIKKQTVEALNDTSHPYRKMLDEVFEGKVRIFDIDNFEDIRPQDVAQKTCVIVSTIQSFRVRNTAGRTVYKHHEMLESHFRSIPDSEAMEHISAEEAEEKGLNEGSLKFSFANLMFYHRPLMIVDEAHNAVSELSAEVQRRLRPGAIIEFTATPRERNNILHSITASALKDEDMIKLPIRLRPHHSWREAITASVAKRNDLAKRGAKDKDRIRPIVLYQAQSSKSEANPEAIKEYLVKEKLIPAERIAIATGTQRELDGIDLKDPACKIEHVITIEALKEGWDCPTAYILCATQKISSETKVEQLLGRVLRMPYAERRADDALNQAYAFVSDPSFHEVAGKLRDKLISMGFTDEEVRASVRPDGVQRDDQTGDLFSAGDDAVDEPIFERKVPDTKENRDRLEAASGSGVQAFPNDDGTITIAVEGEITGEAEAAIEDVVPVDEKSQLEAEKAKHAKRVENAKSPAQRGVSIKVPGIASMLQGELLFADDESIFDGAVWSLTDEPAVLTDGELVLRKDDNIIVIDIENERVIYEDKTDTSQYLPGLAPGGRGKNEAQFVSWLEKQCRAHMFSQTDLSAWLAGVVADLTGRRQMTLKDLVDWEHRIAAAINSKLKAVALRKRHDAFQLALFEDPEIQLVPDRFVFSEGLYRGLPVQRLRDGQVFKKHLLGAHGIPKTDGNPLGEEFQCAVALNGLDNHVDVWIRNVAKHPDSFKLMRPNGHFYYPDFVARLKDGRIFVVEYKGAAGADRDDTREKAIIANLWAQKTGNLYAVIEKVKHGKGMADQMIAAIEA